MPLEFRPIGAQKVLVNTAATLTSYKYDQYGDPTTPVSVTVTVSTADGTVIDVDAATLTDGNQLQYALSTASNTALNWLQAVWTDAGDATSWTTWHEIVGGFYASVSEIRQRDPNLNDAGKYPAATIRSFMEEIETAIELECGRAFVPRYNRVRISGNSKDTLILPDVDIRTVRSGRDYTDYQTYTDFTAIDLANLDWYPSGALTRIEGASWYAGSGNYILEYEHGMDRPPADVKAAAIRWLRGILNAPKSAIPDRASSFSVADGGSYSLITPGLNGAISGIPDVDVVLNRWKIPRYVVGV